MSSLENHTRIIKNIAAKLGFDNIGISKAKRLDEEEERLSNWLKQGFHGEMSYMTNHFEKRLDPTCLVPDSKSVISLTYNYFSEKKQTDNTAPKISKYAYGEDYHFVIKEKLRQFVDAIKIEIGEVSGRVFTDSAPVMERVWAAKSGLGWQGKNTLLINEKRGSFYFLAELILDLELITDLETIDRCGTCTRCIDACPTEAISNDGYLVDASKCISYLTIELKDKLPNYFHDKMDNWMFGCDICQDVCPWNRFAHQHTEPRFEPRKNMLQMDKIEWEEITKEVFNEVFRKSPVKRTKYSGLLRNISFLKSRT